MKNEEIKKQLDRFADDLSIAIMKRNWVYVQQIQGKLWALGKLLEKK